MKYFVYYIKSQSRLFIANDSILNADYQLLLISEGGSDPLQICKTFCMGIIIGASLTGNREKIINDIMEFNH